MVAAPAYSGARATNPGGGRVDADDPAGAALHGQPGDLALAAAEVEHPAGAGEVFSSQRQDLLGVFDIGPARELALPPGGVALPHLDGRRLPLGPSKAF